jgi:hypothetical protein
MVAPATQEGEGSTLLAVLTVEELEVAAATRADATGAAREPAVKAQRQPRSRIV